MVDEILFLRLDCVASLPFTPTLTGQSTSPNLEPQPTLVKITTALLLPLRPLRPLRPPVAQHFSQTSFVFQYKRLPGRRASRPDRATALPPRQVISGLAARPSRFPIPTSAPSTEIQSLPISFSL